jgi:ABC-type uncharacterized transport system permease subunit
MEDKLWLALAVFLYVAAFVPSLRRFRSGTFAPNWGQMLLFLAAFGAHTAFLVARSCHTGHCPITGPLEIAAFVAWSLALTYLATGPIYRITLLGLLTSPLVALLLGGAALFLPDTSHPFQRGLGFEFHASISILAYGALALTALAGILLLAQDWGLKHKRLARWFMGLPPLLYLVRAQKHLLGYGLFLLTLGILSSLSLPGPTDRSVTLWFTAMWFGYLLILAGAWSGRLSPRKTAIGSLLLCLLLLSTFGHIKQATRSRLPADTPSEALP